MPPILGNIIVIAILAVVVFFCGRNVIRSVRAELKGEGTCSGCSGSCSAGKKGSEGCLSCMEGLSELKAKLEEQREI